MRNAISLMRVLTKNAEMRVPKKGGKGSMYLALGIIAISCIMIPCCIIVGFVSYIMTEALVMVNAPAAGLQAEIHIMSAFSVVFGMLVIFNILFFSSDREHLMPMPFRSHEILLAKFFYSYMAESVMEFMVLISMFIGFFISYGVHVSYGINIVGIISALIGVFVIPLVPMAYCAIIGLVLLYCLRGLKNGKIFGRISTITLIAFTVLFLFSFRSMGDITIENYVSSLASGDNAFTNVLDKIFFVVPWLMKAVVEGNILHLLLYLVGNILVIAAMTILGVFTYQQSLYTVGRLGSVKSKLKDNGKHSKQKSVFASYMKKEWLVLTRTRAYNGNCVWINMLWPVLMIGYYLWNMEKPGMQRLRFYFALGTDRAYVLLVIVMIMLAFIASAMNSLASSAFTREGMHLDLVKYIPVPYKTQLLVKGLISILITYPGLFLCVLVVKVVLPINPIWVLILGVLMLLCLIITTISGLYLDSSHPHSTWDDEYSALRGNLNSFFDMAIIMVISVLVCALGFLAFTYTSIGVIGFVIFEFVVTGVMALILCIKGFKMCIKNMQEL